jgi:hypothetical protein
VDVESYFARVEENFGSSAVLEAVLEEIGPDTDLSDADREAIELRVGQYLAHADVEGEGDADVLEPEEERPDGVDAAAFNEPPVAGTR